MKKLVALLLAGVMTVAAFAGCSKKEEPYTNPYSDFTLEELAAMMVDPDLYKGIGISQTEYNEEWDSTFKSQKQSLLTAWAEEITAESENKPALKDGDTVKIDYKGILDGETEPFEGGSATGSSLVLGSDSYIDGFEDGLIGKKVGDEVELKLTFPKDYGKEGTDQAKLNGKKVTFTVKINSAKSVPTYDDALIKKAYKDNDETPLNYETVAEFEESIARDIRSSLALAECQNAIKVKSFPEDIVTDVYNDYMDAYIEGAKAMGTKLAYAVKDLYTMYYLTGQFTTYNSLEDFAKTIKNSAAAQVKNSIIIYYVYNANKEEILSKYDSESDRIVAQFAATANMTVEEYKESFDETAFKDLIIEQLTYEFLGNQATFIDDVKPTETPEATTTPTATPEATTTPTATKTAE